jgi:hypothetical protein
MVEETKLRRRMKDFVIGGKQKNWRGRGGIAPF